MARLVGRLSPAAAVVTALAAFACCVPLGLAGAAGVFVVGTMLERLQTWFMTAAVVLLGIGAYEFYQGQKRCRRGGARFSLLVLALSSAVVLAVLLFPQSVAGLLADYVL